MIHRFCTLLVTFVVLPITSAFAQPDDAVTYSAQIAPILQKYCVGCHNRVEAEHGLSLQAADDILKGDEAGLVFNADAPADSRLLKVLTADGDDHMPPADQPQLTPNELKLLQDWITSGAKFDRRMAIMPALPSVAVTAKKVRNPVVAMAITTEGSSFVGRFRTIEQLDSAGQVTAWKVAVQDGKVNSLRLSADGSRLLASTGVTGLSGRAVAVDLKSAAIVAEFAGHNDILYSAVWSPDESVVATAGYDRKIILHDAKSGKVLRELNGHNGAVFDLDFSPDGTLLASASADATVKIWHVATGERFDTLSQPQSEQYSVEFTPDGRFIFAAGADSRIRKWQLVSKTAPQINPILISRFAHEGVISRMELSADGRLIASASEAGTVKLWEAASVSEIAAWSLEADRVSSLSFDSTNTAIIIETMSGQRQRFAVPDQLPTTTTEVGPAVASMVGSEVKPLVDAREAEPNNNHAAAQKVEFPAKITGLIDGADAKNPDIDAFRFAAKQGETVLIEVKAARDKSPLDSLVEVVTVDGQPILQTKLQAVRDSYFTFRGKDSDTSDDFRVFNWQEMELNEYLYADGEVVKLWLYPRGPDSGFKVYPGFGQRETWFNTTPSSHPLQGPAFIVIPYEPTAELKETGLPVFPIMAENDDDSMRQWGKDSRLMFVPPADGEYVVRLRDARGFQGADFRYELLVRQPQPDFTVAMAGNEFAIHPTTGREIGFTATRLDGYSGPIEIIADNLPAGISLSDPVLIQNEQRQAFATLIAAADAKTPSPEEVAQIKFRAKARIREQDVIHDIGGIKALSVAEKPKVLVRILTSEQHAAGNFEHTPELTVWAGETVRAVLKVERNDHKGLVEFGKEDSGRNLPHGVFVDNIGLNGLMLLEGQNEREFFITTAKWVPETSRPFYLKSSVDGITSLPVMIHVRHRQSDDVKTAADVR